MQVEAEITIQRSPAEVFEHLAHAEHLPDYVREFAWVKQSSPGVPALGTEYSYQMATGQAHGTFEWTRFESSSLAWEGPPARTMAFASMAPAGRWELTERDGATRVKLVMTPRPGGIMKLIAPLLSGPMRKGNVRALEQLKAQLEDRATPEDVS